MCDCFDRDERRAMDMLFQTIRRAGPDATIEVRKHGGRVTTIFRTRHEQLWKSVGDIRS